MSRYRKRPIEVEAFQMTVDTRWDNSDWPDWLSYAWQKEPDEEGCLYAIGISYSEDSYLFIHTLEGPMKVNWGDFIIQGVSKEIYPCKPDIFEKTYEAV